MGAEEEEEEEEEERRVKCVPRYIIRITVEGTKSPTRSPAVVRRHTRLQAPGSRLQIGGIVA